MTFSSETVAAITICCVLAFGIPIAAVAAYKIKKKTAPLSAWFIGAGVFILFAAVLEQALHSVMLPLVSGSNIAYILYAAFAAGLFEETGRFVAFKTVMKRRTNPETAVIFGLGHGGCECMLVLGMSMISGLIVAFSVNSMGLDGFVRSAVAGNPELESTVRAADRGLCFYKPWNRVYVGM